MVYGPTVNICDECVRVSADIVGYGWADEGGVKLEDIRVLRTEIETKDVEIARLKGVLHAQGLSDGAQYCNACERSWFAEIGVDTEEACPWCQIERLVAEVDPLAPSAG